MLQYFIDSYKRKKARRITQKYPTHIDEFNLPEIGMVRFANWENPLVEAKTINVNNVYFFRKFLKEGDLAIDIGANIGYMTVPMSLAMGKNSLTLAFDPNPFVFEILQENAGLNPELSNIQPFNFAISENDEEFYYNSSEASFNNGGISKSRNSRHGKFALDTKIKGIKLEKLLRQNYPDYIKRLKLVKIDTEGYDKEIIKSISNLLREQKPVIITECFLHAANADRFEQFEILKSIGYSLYYISDFDVDAEVIPLNKKEDMLKWKHFDLLGKFD